MATAEKQTELREEGVLPSLLPPVPPELERMRGKDPTKVTLSDFGKFHGLLGDLRAELEKVKGTLRSPRCPPEYVEEGIALFDHYKKLAEEVEGFLDRCQSHREQVSAKR